MITEHDLKEAIAECEGTRNPTANTCLKLAAFYQLKDRMFPETSPQEVRREIPQYSYAPSAVEREQSDFLQAADGMDHDKLMSIMDELMTTVQVMIPKLYAGVMRKLTE